MKSINIDLIPRFCPPEDSLKGYMCIHSKHRPGVRHLHYVKIKCIDTDETVFCKIRGPGTGPGLYYKYFEEKLKTVSGNVKKEEINKLIEESIFFDSFFLEKLKLDGEMGKCKKWRINYGGRIVSTWFWLKYCLGHPDDSIRMGCWLGLISVILGVISLMLGSLSMVLVLN